MERGFESCGLFFAKRLTSSINGHLHVDDVHGAVNHRDLPSSGVSSARQSIEVKVRGRDLSFCALRASDTLSTVLYRRYSTSYRFATAAKSTFESSFMFLK